jgi:chromosomal replication initiator protein
LLHPKESLLQLSIELNLTDLLIFVLSQEYYETRVAILKKKTYKDGLNMPDEVLEYIAQNITTNVRELEGALISLLAQSTLNKKAITVDLAIDLINKIVKQSKHEITIDYIQKIICDYFNMPLDALQSKTRKREIVQARQIAMYFSKSLTKSTAIAIASSGSQ